MNTQLSNDQKSLDKWKDIIGFKNEDEEIEHESQMLMYSFLSEVEKFQDLQDVSKKKLSEKIKTSASYLTQIFRGDKPLNFNTLAKIQRALRIKFDIKAKSLDNLQYSQQGDFKFDNLDLSTFGAFLDSTESNLSNPNRGGSVINAEWKATK